MSMNDNLLFFIINKYIIIIERKTKYLRVWYVLFFPLL